jgi:hypothetical protein
MRKLPLPLLTSLKKKAERFLNALPSEDGQVVMSDSEDELRISDQKLSKLICKYGVTMSTEK